MGQGSHGPHCHGWWWWVEECPHLGTRRVAELPAVLSPRPDHQTEPQPAEWELSCSAWYMVSVEEHDSDPCAGRDRPQLADACPIICFTCQELHCKALQSVIERPQNQATPGPDSGQCQSGHCNQGAYRADLAGGAGAKRSCAWHLAVDCELPTANDTSMQQTVIAGQLQ